MWGHMHRCFEAGPGAPRAARKCTHDWLEHLGWKGPECDDVVLAVSEAVTNAVEHAYPRDFPGQVIMDADTVTGPDGEQRVRITVTDHGMWREPEPSPEFAGCVPVRGRGLTMIRAAMSRSWLDANSDGTRLTMISKAVHPTR